MFGVRALTCSGLRHVSAASRVTKQLPQLSFATSSVRPSSGDHVKMWTAERAVSIAQVPAVILPFMFTNPMTDAMFCTLAVLHSHWGIEAIVVDYIRPALFNGSTFIPNLCVGWVKIINLWFLSSFIILIVRLVWLLSAVTLGSLFYFNYSDVGIVNAIKMLWRL